VQGQRARIFAYLSAPSLRRAGGIAGALAAGISAGRPPQAREDGMSETDHEGPAQGPAGADDLPEAARRALAEARARRAAIDARAEAMPRERGGRDGPEPVRYGDWERKGLASDF
jgi:hypothetical protein